VCGEDIEGRRHDFLLAVQLFLLPARGGFGDLYSLGVGWFHRVSMKGLDGQS
jgi:hypothetical protein